VTFAYSSDSEHLQTSWPWLLNGGNTTETNEQDKPLDTPSEFVRSAIQYKFRVTTKKRWLEFKAEYLSYRQQLIEEINAYEDAHRHTQTHLQQESVVAPALTSIPKQHAPSTSLTPFSPYPPDCLVLVKHIHPDTTKTTLRAFFSPAFRSLDQKTTEGLGYVDFNKGMDRVRTIYASHFLVELSLTRN
jgi:hypothetical protein